MFLPFLRTRFEKKRCKVCPSIRSRLASIQITCAIVSFPPTEKARQKHTIRTACIGV